MNREHARIAVQRALWNAKNYPPAAQPYILGRDITPLVDAVLDSLLASGVIVTDTKEAAKQ